jgi:hypothetical protein
MSQRYYMTSLGRRPTGPSTAIIGSDADVLMFRYVWPGTLNGGDADTFTGIEPGTGTSYDGIKNASGAPTRYVGYAPGGGMTSTVGSTTGINTSTTLIYWAGDNTSTAGQEVVLVRPKSIAALDTSITRWKIGIYLNWYDTVGVGCMDFIIRCYSGSTFSDTGTDISASGGTLLRTYLFNANTNNQNNPSGTGYPSNGINGYAQIGIFEFFSSGDGFFRYNLTSIGSCSTENDMA